MRCGTAAQTRNRGEKARSHPASTSDSAISLVPYDQAYERGFEDTARRLPDTTKLERFTGWQPERSLDDILAEMVAEAAREAVPEPG